MTLTSFEGILTPTLLLVMASFLNSLQAQKRQQENRNCLKHGQMGDRIGKQWSGTYLVGAGLRWTCAPLQTASSMCWSLHASMWWSLHVSMCWSLPVLMCWSLPVLICWSLPVLIKREKDWPSITRRHPILSTIMSKALFFSSSWSYFFSMAAFFLASSGAPYFICYKLHFKFFMHPNATNVTILLNCNKVINAR